MVCEGRESCRIDEVERNKVVGGDGEGGDSGGGGGGDELAEEREATAT